MSKTNEGKLIPISKIVKQINQRKEASFDVELSTYGGREANQKEEGKCTQPNLMLAGCKSSSSSQCANPLPSFELLTPQEKKSSQSATSFQLMNARHAKKLGRYIIHSEVAPTLSHSSAK